MKFEKVMPHQNFRSRVRCPTQFCNRIKTLSIIPTELLHNKIEMIINEIIITIYKEMFPIPAFIFD